MAGTFLGKYDTTAANNTATGTGSVSVAEGMLPSNINNAFRSVMADIRQWYNDGQWIEYGDGAGTYTATRTSGTAFTISSTNVTSAYHANRRIKLVDSATTLYGTISSSSFSSDTTVNVTWDTGSITAGSITSVYLGILTNTNHSFPGGIIGTTQLADDSVTTGKILNGTIANADINASAAIDATKIHDGTISNTEFGYLNNVSSNIQTQLDAKQATITGSATTIDTESLTADRAVISNGSQKIAVSDVTSTELGYLDGVTSAVQTQLDAKCVKANNLNDVSSASSARTNLGLAIGSDVQAYDAQLADVAGLTPTDSNFIVGDGSNFTTESGATARTSLGLGSIATQAANSVAITGGSVTGLSAPSGATDVAIKSYVDDLVAGLKTRIICRAATTANIDLAADLQNGDTLDGITLATGNRVLVKDQSTGSQNGIYTVVASGTAARDTDFDAIGELAGQLVIVQEGSTNADRIYLCTTDTSASLGSSTITFSRVTPSYTGTVTSVGIADGGSSEFTVGSTPVTTSGNITLTVNAIDTSKITNGASKGFATAMAIAL